ncbi:MAG TPA: DUF4199 domain-containing protein [Vicinamibacterales bacterium]|nr:DUF4199 domain-containing protein [Vicinamibacterales bacterium]
MAPIPAAGLLIGVLCGVWTFVMGYTGWYKDPAKASAFFVVVLIEVAGLIWGLRKTAAEGRTYSGQVVAGTLMSIVAGVVIIAASVLFTTWAFPDYFREIEAAYRGLLRQQGKTEAEIASEIAAWSAGQTPMRQAMNGFMGTFVTGVVVSAIVAIWIRARPAAVRG